MRVVTANFFAANQRKTAAAAALAELQADAYLLNETQHAHPHLRQFGTLHGEETGSKGRRECVVVTRPTVTVHDSGTIQLTRAVPGHSKFWHDRWATFVTGECEGQRVALWSWHGNAAIRRRTGGVRTNSKGAIRYATGMGRLAGLVAEHTEAGYTPIVGGDANLSRREASWPGSPWAHLEQDLGLRIVSHGVDQVAWDPDEFGLLSQRILRDPPGADHDWIVVDLDPITPAPVPTGWTVRPLRAHLAAAIDAADQAPANRPRLTGVAADLRTILDRIPQPQETQ